jgi:hypothetical protein
MPKCKRAEAAPGQDGPPTPVLPTLPNEALQTPCDPPFEGPEEQPLLRILFNFCAGLEAALNRELDPDPEQAPSATLFLSPLTPITPSEDPCNAPDVAKLLQAVSDRLQQEPQPALRPKREPQERLDQQAENPAGQNKNTICRRAWRRTQVQAEHAQKTVVDAFDYKPRLSLGKKFKVLETLQCSGDAEEHLKAHKGAWQGPRSDQHLQYHALDNFTKAGLHLER